MNHGFAQSTESTESRPRRVIKRLALGLVALTAATSIAAATPSPAAAAIYLDLVGCRRDTNSVMVAQSAADYVHVKLLRWNGTRWKVIKQRVGLNSVTWHGLRNGYYAVKVWVTNNWHGLWYRAYPRNYQIFGGSSLRPIATHRHYCRV